MHILLQVMKFWQLMVKYAMTYLMLMLFCYSRTSKADLLPYIYAEERKRKSRKCNILDLVDLFLFLLYLLMTEIKSLKLCFYLFSFLIHI